MSILDDAIREHLELKRAHGADEAELKRLEDEAFGPPGRPEEAAPFAEAPTEFLATEAEGEALAEEEHGGRRINIADLQEPPPPEQPVAQSEAAHEQSAAEEQSPSEPVAMEHELPAEADAEPAAPAPEPPVEPIAEAGPSTEERQAIAEQPTELFDIEAQMDSGEAPAAEAASPSDEEILDEKLAEPRLAPGGRFNDEPAPAEEYEDEEDDDFWSDQRLSDELDQALEAPVEDEPSSEEYETKQPPTEQPSSKHTDEHERLEQPRNDRDTGHDDVLEDTPDFLEDAPEDDDLWFEQRPPKDFDFDD